jgi:hypothetical protein
VATPSAILSMMPTVKTVIPIPSPSSIEWRKSPSGSRSLATSLSPRDALEAQSKWCKTMYFMLTLSAAKTWNLAPLNPMVSP